MPWIGLEKAKVALGGRKKTPQVASGMDQNIASE